MQLNVLHTFYLLSSLVVFFSCTPLHRESQQERVWRSLSTDRSPYSLNAFINIYPLSPHFNKACEHIIEIESKTDPITGCFLNAIPCYIQSEDSIYIQENIYGFQNLDSIIHQILLEHRFEKTLQINQNPIRYSDSYFIIPITENKLNLQRWVYQIKQGVNLYGTQIYNSAHSLPNVQFKDLNKLEHVISSKIILTRPTPYRIPSPPPPN